MILHIDMDAFFASVEQRDNPQLKGRPIVVSRDHNRSVVAAASYEARKYGIHSAMPVFKAKKRCGHLIFVPGNMRKYQAASRQIMQILSSFSPLVEQMSIDEAYVDINGCERLFGNPRQIGEAIKKTIFEQVSLTSSVGIAPLKFLSKIASDMDKPNGLTLIEKSMVSDFIRQLSIEKVPGVGKRAMKQMDLLQIHTLGDVRQYRTELLVKKFGKMGKRLVELAHGIDATSIVHSYERKSISSETTLSRDISEFDAVKQIILDRSQTVGRQLRNKSFIATIVFVKLKFTDFSQMTRQKKLDMPISSSTAIFDEALSLFEKINLKKKIRLVGVGVGGLKDKDSPVQLSLITKETAGNKQWDTVDAAVDHISEKFGTHAVKKAALKDLKHRRKPDEKSDSSKG